MAPAGERTGVSARPIRSHGGDNPSSPTPARDRVPGKKRRSRTSHACDRCRLMRTKCSGGPRCSKCIKDDAVCEFGDRRRERNKKELAESLDHIAVLKEGHRALSSALSALANRSDMPPRARDEAMEALSKYSIPGPVDHASVRDSSAKSQTSSLAAKVPSSYAGTSASGASGETTAPSGADAVGRQADLSHAVDLGRGGGAAGFIGKMSEMTWIQRAFDTLKGYPSRPRPDASNTTVDSSLKRASHFVYFVDHTDVLGVNEDHIDPHQLPALEVALIKTEAFFHAMHAFPFILREQFIQQIFHRWAAQPGRSWTDTRWHALANIMWAIGSKWLELAKLDSPDSMQSHLTFYARARALGLDHRVMFDHPDIARVQEIGLLAVYLFINGSISRAWTTLGHATRHATALGLHLQVSDPEVDELDRANRARTWYSLYSLEVMIAEVTGRPKSVSLCDVTTPIELLAPNREAGADASRHHHGPGESNGQKTVQQSKAAWHGYLKAVLEQGHRSAATDGAIARETMASVTHGVPSAYLGHRVAVCRLSDQIATELYSGTAMDAWVDVQRKIGQLESELRTWADNLPDQLAIGYEVGNGNSRVQIELAMYYHSIQMIVHRPCLCDLTTENQPVPSLEFSRSSARACVEAAISMVALLPDGLTAPQAYQILPWWSLLHFVAQAAAVLLLELALKAQHCEDEVSQLIHSLRKAMEYLWRMTESSLSAYRAWRIFQHLLAEVLKRNASFGPIDVPQQASPPAGWTDELEKALLMAVEG